MNETIRGDFHPYPVGAHVWECTKCHRPFCWSDGCTSWGNVEYAFAVFCSYACTAHFPIDECKRKELVPIGVIGEDRVAKAFAWWTPADRPP